MNEKQLKLAKLYAELIDVEILEYKGALLYPNDQGYMCENGVTCDWFNPFIGQLQLDARDKFEVHTDYINKSVSMWSVGEFRDDVICRAEIKSKGYASTAVIECILKSKGLIQ